MDQSRKNEILAISLLALTLFLLASFISFDFNDLGLFSSRPNSPIKNYTGIVGAYIAGFCFFTIGFSSYVLPILILIWAVARFMGLAPQKLYLKITGTLSLILASSSLFSMFGGPDSVARFRFGGMTGMLFLDFLLRYIGRAGAIIVIAILFLLSILLATEFLLLPFIVTTFKWARDFATRFRQRSLEKKRLTKAVEGQRYPKKITPEVTPGREPARAPKEIQEAQPLSLKREGPQVREALVTPGKPIERPISKKPSIPIEQYRLPSLDLLDNPPPVEERQIKEDFEESARILEETLADFDIEAKVVNCNKGPVITRYELEPGSGVKVHRITSLGDNIALAMKAQSIRIVAPIPGKGTIGIEVPNSISTLVYLKEVLDSEEYRDFDSGLKIALGKDIAGNPVIADLASMPHLLIAGATGSGKTVCVNSVITSLLFNFRPDELKLIMVDPKRVELAIFNDLPHLLAPVVTEPKNVSATLDWVVGQMDSRYELFAKSGVRNIDLYNEKFGKDPAEKLPYIIIIIDELADLMMVAQADIEGAITRLSQLSRAVGIHIILATQRPSVNVITGVIKANFPARISFRVASKVDSRTVLDMNGADKLLGKGDMLFLDPGTEKPIRAQGCLISDREIERIASFIKSQTGPEYVEEILEVQKKGPLRRSFEKDEVYEEAVRLVLETRQASVSILQRRLGLGYTRAARIVDMMEDDGIVGPYQGSKPRDILVQSLEELEKK